MEHKKQQDLQYVKSLFDNTTKVIGTVLKLDVEEGFMNYKNKIGNPMDEGTLIVGDSNNNVFIVFKKNDRLVPVKIFDGVNIIPHLKYGNGCILHRKQEPTDVPTHIINILTQNNVYNFTENTTNYFNNLNLNTEKTHTKRTHSDKKCASENDSLSNECSSSITATRSSTSFESFMHRLYNKGGMVPIKNVRRNPEWNKEYETYITTKKINMCKSCKSRAHKGCCSEYSSGNRVMIKMIIGWSE